MWMTNLADSPRVRWAHVEITSEQVKVAAGLGIPLAPDDTFLIASARIVDAVADAIGERPTNAPTEKQMIIANELGIDIGFDSRRVASVKIKQAIQERDYRENAIEQMSLRPGDLVEPNAEDCTYWFQRIVSSIRWDGLVFFKGTQGGSAHARTLKRIEITD